MQNKPVITISLKPHLADFLRHEFPETNDTILLTRTHDIGKFISACVLISEFPVKRPLIENPVKLQIPITPLNKHFICKHFIYVSNWSEQKITDYIEAEFKRRVRDYFEIGYKKGYKQKDIINAFMEGYNIKNFAINFEAIKKIDYRNNRKFRQNVFSDIQTFVNQ